MDFSYISQRLIEHTALEMSKYHNIQKLEGLRYIDEMSTKKKPYTKT